MDFLPFVNTLFRPRIQVRPRYLRQLSLILAASVAVVFWLQVGAEPVAQDSPFDPNQQNSPVASPNPDPFATATPDPFATATPDPFATATPDPFATATPDPFATATPDPFATAIPDPFAIPTPDPFATATVDAGIAPDAAATPSAAATPLLLIPPADRAIVPPPPAQPLAFAAIVDDVLHSMANVAVWLWFVCGSLIFFVVAGVIGGIYFSQRERMRYDLYTLEADEHAHFEFQDDTERRPLKADDDVWPASLP